MQVFLPYPDYRASYETLDKKRCFKQVIEDGQLINALLTENPKRIFNHPACRMFRGYINSLIEHHNIGFDVCRSKWGIKFVKTKLINQLPDLNTNPPFWLGDDRFHSAHRAALLDKDWEFYSKYGWTEKPERAYWWPV